ncbi:unnamed protein product [Ambrosiozyma monospora]|uniref:Unnamed protein product n=1 Tax=Ambrosiozyma monospora TaxID=43982 RepID=A0ACB5SWU0_AMBMO|nr:unnamed protein product [Ambrosiozyma monospora]
MAQADTEYLPSQPPPSFGTGSQILDQMLELLAGLLTGLILGCIIGKTIFNMLYTTTTPVSSRSSIFEELGIDEDQLNSELFNDYQTYGSTFDEGVSIPEHTVPGSYGARERGRERIFGPSSRNASQLMEKILDDGTVRTFFYDSADDEDAEENGDDGKLHLTKIMDQNENTGLTVLRYFEMATSPALAQNQLEDPEPDLERQPLITSHQLIQTRYVIKLNNQSPTSDHPYSTEEPLLAEYIESQSSRTDTKEDEGQEKVDEKLTDKGKLIRGIKEITKRFMITLDDDSAICAEKKCCLGRREMADIGGDEDRMNGVAVDRNGRLVRFRV